MKNYMNKNTRKALLYSRTTKEVEVNKKFISPLCVFNLNAFIYMYLPLSPSDARALSWLFLPRPPAMKEAESGPAFHKPTCNTTQPHERGRVLSGGVLCAQRTPCHTQSLLLLNSKRKDNPQKFLLPPFVQQR